MMNKIKLNLIQGPNNCFTFVGLVPCTLGYTTADGAEVTPELVEKQHMLPSNYRSIKSRRYSTREDAVAAAAELGFEVNTNK